MRSVSVEKLERRQLLSSTTLQLQGTSGNDTISIAIEGAEVRSVINGVVTYTAEANVSDVLIQGLSGADQIYVESNSDNLVTILGGAGNDSIIIASNAGNLDAIDSEIIVDAGENGGSLTLYDDHVSYSDTYSINSTSVHRSGFAGVTFNSALTSLVLQAQSGNNIFNVESTPTASMTIYGRNGDDVLNVTPSAKNLSNVQGSLNFQGGGGTDSLRLYDGNNAAPDEYLISAVAISRASMGNVNFDAESVSLYEGSANNSTSVSSFTQPNLYIDASAGADTMTFNGIGPMSSVTAIGHVGDDTFYVETTSPGSQLQLNGETGNDQGFFAHESRDLAGIQGSVGFDGGSNSDVVIFDDTFQTIGVTYEFSSTQISTPLSGTMSYSSSERVELQADEGPSTINITNTLSTIEQRAYGNGNGDSINVLDTVVPVWISGGDGLDIYVIDSDLGNPAQAKAFEDDELSELIINANSRLEILSDVTISTTTETNLGAINFDRRASHIVKTTIPITLAQARTRVTSGYANGTWNGTAAAYSSTYSANSIAGDGIGFARGADLGVNHYDGMQVNANDLVFTQTLLGDATLDHAVNFSDLLKLAQNYNGSNKFWLNGDFDYDQSVSFDDLLKLAQNYGASGIIHTTLKDRERISSTIRSNW
ncbi:MAG TPA: hypothetical protein PK402_02125 [Tepidisphaeraceae bacterium]|nr:hypothetical protein [Tepidisphaeraceae bacterium]